MSVKISISINNINLSIEGEYSSKEILKVVDGIYSMTKEQNKLLNNGFSPSMFGNEFGNPMGLYNPNAFCAAINNNGFGNKFNFPEQLNPIMNYKDNLVHSTNGRFNVTCILTMNGDCMTLIHNKENNKYYYKLSNEKLDKIDVTQYNSIIKETKEKGIIVKEYDTTDIGEFTEDKSYRYHFTVVGKVGENSLVDKTKTYIYDREDKKYYFKNDEDKEISNIEFSDYYKEILEASNKNEILIIYDRNNIE